MRRAHAAGAAAALAGLLALAACSSSSTAPGTAGTASAGSAATGSLATSLATSADTWALVPASANPAYWQVLVRPATSGSWRLVTPSGVASNGGLVAASTGSALTVAVRPSENLVFTPLAATSDGGTHWSTGGPLEARVANSPDALAASGSSLAALLSDGAIETSGDAGTTWRTLAAPGAIAASPAGKECGTVTVTSVSFGAVDSTILAAGTCGTTGTGALFDHSSSGTWQRLSLPTPGQVVRLAGAAMLMRTKAGLTPLWGSTGWYAYAPLSSTTPGPTTITWGTGTSLPVTGAITASGGLADGGAWVLMPGGRAATIAAPQTPASATPQWLLLPPLPAKTTVLASGPGSSIDALAVSGATVTVWRLARASTVWSKVQTISVPVQYGSSS
jgi:hypothetical protein